MRHCTALVVVWVLLFSAYANGQGRYTRLLNASREGVRNNTIDDLANSPAKLRGAINDVIKAMALHEAAALKNPDATLPTSTARLVFLIASLDHDLATAEVYRLLDSTHAQIAMSAIDALGTYNKHPGVIDQLIRQAERSEYQTQFGFRVCLLRAISRIRAPEAVEFLTTQENKLRGQLGYSVRAALDKVNADSFAGDIDRYERWVAMRKDPEPKSGIKLTGGAPSEYQRMRLTPGKYYGMDLIADRLVFVLDRSGSMEEVSSGFSRLERAKRELMLAVDGLPETTQFAIIFYESGVRVWNEDLVPATIENKRLAQAFLSRIDPGNQTNTHGALTTALNIKNVETVFFLSDGIPTVGDVVAPVKIAADIRERNRFKNITVNAIGVSVSPVASKFMETLAVQNGGEYRAVH